jgi:uncharacterized protein
MDRELLFKRLGFDAEVLERFCAKWRVGDLALFGSILRDDFSPDSDIDVLVTFLPDAPWSLWDLIAMQQEFERLAGRPADIIEKTALRNPFLRHEVLSRQEVLYVARAA